MGSWLGRRISIELSRKTKKKQPRQVKFAACELQVTRNDWMDFDQSKGSKLEEEVKHTAEIQSLIVKGAYIYPISRVMT